MINGILWDNDGVLVDSEHLFFEVNRDFLRPYGVELSEAQFFDWFLCENRGAWHLLLADGVPQSCIKGLRAERNARYTERVLAESALAVAGIEQVLEQLNGRVEMGVVTSASREHYDAIHRHLTLNRHFSFVLTSETYENRKPSPEPYLLGLQRLNLAAGQCLVIEDSPRGLQAAMAAGIRCIVLRNRMTKGYPFAGAYRVVDSVAQLLAAIQAALADVRIK